MAAALGVALATLSPWGGAAAQDGDRSWPVAPCAVASDDPVREVRGVVRDPEGVPLAGAIVRTADPTCGTLTDAQGRFGLRAPLAAGDSLVFELVGMARRSVAVPAEEAGNAPLPLGPVELRYAGDVPALMPLRAAPEAHVTGALVGVPGCYALSHDPGWWGATELPAIVRVVVARRDDRAVLRVEDATAGSPPGDPRHRAWTVWAVGDTLLAAWARPGLFLWGMRYRMHPTDVGLSGLAQFESHEPGSRTEPEPAVWRRNECPAVRPR